MKYSAASPKSPAFYTAMRRRCAIGEGAWLKENVSIWALWVPNVGGSEEQGLPIY